MLGVGWGGDAIGKKSGGGGGWVGGDAGDDSPSQPKLKSSRTGT